MAMHVDYIDTLPIELKDRIVAIRREIKAAKLVFVLGLPILISIGAISKYLKARGYSLL
jgi:hypothetical protein